jgi:hypothetical protein
LRRPVETTALSGHSNRARECPLLNVRFGSFADICSAKPHVRFTPQKAPYEGLVVRAALWESRDRRPLTFEVAYMLSFQAIAGF